MGELIISAEDLRAIRAQCEARVADADQRTIPSQ
jgi:hypothetical protein